MPQPSGSLLSQDVALATSLSLATTPLSLTTSPLSLTVKEPRFLRLNSPYLIHSISAAFNVLWGPSQVAEAEPSHTSAWLAHSTSTSTFFGSESSCGRAL